MENKIKITMQLSPAAARRAVKKAGGDPADMRQVEQIIKDSVVSQRVWRQDFDAVARTLAESGYIIV